MIEQLLELVALLALLGPIPFLLGQIQIDELFFDVVVKGGAGAQAQIQKFSGSLQKVEPAGTAAGKGVDRFSRSSVVATGASAGLGVAVKRLVGIFGGLFILRRVVGAMVSFQTTMAEVATIADRATVDVDELTRGVLALSRESPTSADELGAAAYQILSAGVQNTADVFTVLEASQRAAVAGLTSTEVAADALTTVINAFGLDASEATRVADVLFKTVELGKIRFEEISATIGNAATSAGLAGVSIEELSAGVVALTRVGVDAAEATTSLNRLFLTLTSQSKQQEQAFRDLGIEFNLATVQEKGFAGLLEEVNELSGENLDILSELFPNIRAARAAFVIAGQGADLFNSALEDLLVSQGSVDAAFEILNRTAANQARILRNNVIATFQEIGLDVLPGVSVAFEFISFAISNFVGTIKVLGAEAPVAFQRLKVGAIGAAQAVDTFARDALQGLDRFLTGLADRLRVVAALPFPGAELAGVVAAGFDAAARGAARAAEAQEMAIATRARSLEQEKENLALLEIGFQETVLLIAAEQEFLRTRNERAAAGEEAAKREAQAAQLTKEELDARRELTSEVLDEVAKLTNTAVELQIIEFEKLEARVAAIFGDEIPQDVRDGLDKIAAELDSAKVIEAAEMLGAEIGERIEAGLEAIEIDVALADLVDEEERRAELLERQAAFLESQRVSLRAQLGDIRLETKERDAIRRQLAAVVKLIQEAKKEQKDLTKDVAAEATARANAIVAQAAAIGNAAAGAADLAAEFGLVDDELNSVIGNMLQLGQSVVGVVAEVSKLAAGVGSLTGLLAGGIGAIGAISGIIGTIFGGPSPEAIAFERTLAENSDRLKELRESVERLRGTFDIAGADFAEALRQLTGPQAEIGLIAQVVEADIEAGGFREELAFELIENFENRLRMLGVDIANLDEVAEEFGITIRDNAGNIIPSAIVQLTEALLLAEGAFVGFADTVEGQFSRIRAEFEIFDIEDPLEQLNRIRLALLGIGAVDPAQVFEILADSTLSFAEKVERLRMVLRIAGQQVAPFIQELLEIDVSTPEGRAAADKLIRDLFLQLSTGQITPEELGAATFDEAVQILLELEGLLDTLGEQTEEETEELEGQTQDIRRTVQITELQANQLLAFQSTLVVRAEQRNILLEQIRDILAGVPTVGGPPPEPPPIVDGDDIIPLDGRLIGPPIEVDSIIDTIIVDAEISVGEGVTVEQLEDAREILVEELAEDLGDRLAEEERLVGLPRIVRERISR